MIVTNYYLLFFFLFYLFIFFFWNLKFYSQLENINITRQVFLEITDGKFYEDSRVFDGILGLSLPYEDPNLYNCSVIPTMRKDQLIEKQIVAFYFNRYNFFNYAFSFFLYLFINEQLSGNFKFKTCLKISPFYKLFLSEVNITRKKKDEICNLFINFPMFTLF